jgi:hypothetical protein
MFGPVHCTHSQWSENGDKPYHRYFRVGLRDHVVQNIYGQDVQVGGGGQAAAMPDHATHPTLMFGRLIITMR